MHKYDKIYVPNDLDQLKTKYMLIGPDSHYPIGGLDERENLICLTVEELREIWDDGEYQGEQWAKYMNGGSFEDFLTGKGIQL